MSSLSLEQSRTDGGRLSYLRKGDSLRWTAYCDECLRVLDASKEEASDALLVRLVKLRLINEQIMDASWTISGDVYNTVRPPVEFYLHSVQSQLRELKRSIPAELNKNRKSLTACASLSSN